MGFYFGDGQKSGHKSIVVTSKKCIDDMIRIALMCGALPRRRRILNHPGKKKAYAMSLMRGSLDDIKRVSKGGVFMPRIHKDACHFKIGDSWLLGVRIKSKKTISSPGGFVYDIETSGTHTLSGLTIAVHNCDRSGNIITLQHLLENQKKRDIVRKLALQCNIRLSRMARSAKIEPLHNEVLAKFCEEQYALMEIGTLGHELLKAYGGNEDVVNKVSRVYQKAKALADIGDNMALDKLKADFMETMYEYEGK
jgi:hypothetical protein